jgi:hypothetical protein
VRGLTLSSWRGGELESRPNSLLLVRHVAVELVSWRLDGYGVGRVSPHFGGDLLLNASEKSARQYYIAKVLQSVASRNK